MARKKVSAWIWGRQEYLYQGKVYEYPSGRFDTGPGAGPPRASDCSDPIVGNVRVRKASPEDLARFGVR